MPEDSDGTLPFSFQQRRNFINQLAKNIFCKKFFFSIPLAAIDTLKVAGRSRLDNKLHFITYNFI